MTIAKIMVALEDAKGLWDFEFITPDGQVVLSHLRVFSVTPYNSGKIYRYIPLEEFQAIINRTGNYADL